MIYTSITKLSYISYVLEKYRLFVIGTNKIMWVFLFVFVSMCVYILVYLDTSCILIFNA